MDLINGNEIAQEIIEELKIEVSSIKGGKPCVVFVRVGEDQIDVVEPLEQAVAMGRRDVETVARTVRAGHFLTFEIDGNFAARRGM